MKHEDLIPQAATSPLNPPSPFPLSYDWPRGAPVSLSTAWPYIGTTGSSTLSRHVGLFGGADTSSPYGLILVSPAYTDGIHTGT